jgi:SAM-dependent methyltransferase
MMAPPMQRMADTPEHLDGPLTDQDILAGNLRDLRRINRFFGGVALSRRAIDALIGTGLAPIRVLDVGTGGADIPVALLAAWRRRGVEARITAVDSRPEVLRAAIAERPLVGRIPELELAVAEGLALPYADASFDVVHASLLLHHFEPPQAEVLIREMSRVASAGIVLNDLARGRVAWLGAWLLVHAATGNGFTRHDGPLSVRRAYTLPEARALLGRAGLRIVDVERGLLGRWAVAAVRA